VVTEGLPASPDLVYPIPRRSLTGGSTMDALATYPFQTSLFTAVIPFGWGSVLSMVGGALFGVSTIGVLASVLGSLVKHSTHGAGSSRGPRLVAVRGRIAAAS